MRQHRYGEGALPRRQNRMFGPNLSPRRSHSNVCQIDPKRAIPREEQERTSKIFVGGVSQEATEEDFTSFFKQFGRVVDATLMMDKETGRPRGFGFVTFDGDAAVDATLRGPLQILGKQIEVKRAQPRGNMRDDEGGDSGGGGKKFGRGKFNKFNDNGGHGGGGGGGGGGGYENNNGGNGGMGGQGGTSGMSPAMMAQYWQRMQQYFQSMQQTLAQQQAGGGMPMPGNPMAGMNPMQMQAMQQQMMGAGMNRGTGSPNPQMMGGMNPMQMQQQMQQMGGPQGPGGPGMMSPQGGNGGGPQRPAYTPQEQLAFEQQKYEQQQARRQQQLSGPAGPQGFGGGPSSWEGMYDDQPPPNVPSGPGGRGGRGGFNGGFQGGNNRSRQGSSQPGGAGPAPPINAPTGPKNAGVRGANYRGGGRGGGGGFRHQPYGGRGN
jgi:RNA-binding protein Musashi